MVGARVSRGFRRLGLVVALPALVLAVGASVLAGVGMAMAPTELPGVSIVADCQKSSPGLFDDIPIVAPPKGFQLDPPQTVGDADFERCLASHREKADAWQANHRAILAPYDAIGFASASAAIGVIWFALCWAIGWVLAGFARDA